MANIIKLGSILLDGVHVEPGSEYQAGQAISLGDGDDLQWVVVNGLLIAERPVLINISWENLNQQGFVHGRQGAINGQQFLCRLLKVGNKKDVPNEWDGALDAVGEDDSLWHWRNAFCWGQEILNKYESVCVIRGFRSARFYGWTTASDRLAFYGFRPALVPLPSDHSALRLGQAVIAVGCDGCVAGELVAETQYDFIIRPKADGVTGAALFTTEVGNNLVAVDRSRVLSITVT